MTAADIAHILATLDWQEFDSLDIFAFSGVTTSHPMIAYDFDTTYVLDGDTIIVHYAYDEEGQIFSASKTFTIKAQEI